MAKRRPRDVISFPLLFLLHLLFTLSSLFVRFLELFPEKQHRQLNTSVLRGKPPKHVALVLSLPAVRAPAGSDVIIRSGEAKALVSSVRRAADWAGEEGIQEISIYEGRGLLQTCRGSVLQALLRLPPSPPSSGASSPPLPSRDAKNDIDSVMTLTVFRTCNRDMDPQPVTVHLLPPSSSGTLLANLARAYASSHTPSRSIIQKRLDADIKEAMHFTSEPDLLLIHPLTRAPIYRALSPRPAPELAGYPFWTLSITEIYQHPTPLPLPRPLIAIYRPLLARARKSSLPLIRKIARLLPGKRHRETEEIEVEGALRREEWEGAMEAWCRVEQRLGR